MFERARKVAKSTNAEWDYLNKLIDGVRRKELRNQISANSVVSEVYRRDWEVMPNDARHLICLTMNPGAVSAWHLHQYQTDNFAVAAGILRLVLYDDREGSPTKGMVNTLLIAQARPLLVTTPPGIWHGLQNAGPGCCVVLNIIDREYNYDEPDEWRMPVDCEEIPYRFIRP